MIKKRRHPAQTATLWLALLVGACYGVLVRWMFGTPSLATMFSVMSSSFVIATPLCLGFLCVWIATRSGRIGFHRSALLPLGAAGLYLIGTLVLAMEGIICVIMIAPVIALFATLGGIFAEWVRSRTRSQGANVPCLCGAVVLPLLLSPIELSIEANQEIRSVDNSISIAASPAVIWREIRSVKAIQSSELPDSWIYRLGFPKPTEAILVGETVGGYREARFTGGLRFRETIFEWTENKSLAFTIRANTGEIPTATFDEHIIVGGPYFDVLEGRYEILQVSEQECVLKLSSKQRLSTRFNVYARFWTEAVMSEIQSNILEVVKERAESL